MSDRFNKWLTQCALNKKSIAVIFRNVKLNIKHRFNNSCFIPSAYRRSEYAFPTMRTHNADQTYFNSKVFRMWALSG